MEFLLVDTTIPLPQARPEDRQKFIDRIEVSTPVSDDIIYITTRDIEPDDQNGSRARVRVVAHQVEWE